MRNGKYTKRGVATKALVMILAVMMIVGATIGGTLAWLTANTATVTNTFTYGDITIDIEETGATQNGENWEKTYKMVPGNTLSKDPTVIVEKDSEACWLFVKIEESANFDDFMTYAIADGWTVHQAEDANHVTILVREVDAVTADTEFGILKGDTVTVNSDVTKAQLQALGTNYPTLKFSAYAVQKDNVNTAADAWAIATTPAA